MTYLNYWPQNNAVQKYVESKLSQKGSHDPMAYGG
jgi:hypothetical protein